MAIRKTNQTQGVKRKRTSAVEYKKQITALETKVKSLELTIEALKKHGVDPIVHQATRENLKEVMENHVLIENFFNNIVSPELDKMKHTSFTIISPFKSRRAVKNWVNLGQLAVAMMKTSAYFNSFLKQDNITKDLHDARQQLLKQLNNGSL